MSDIKKILDTLSEMATTSGAVATVAAPLGATRTRAKGTPSIYGEQIDETEVEETETKTDDVVNGVKTPANFGLWQNSYHQADQQKKRRSAKKKVAESRDEASELDRPEIQAAMKRMKAKYDADPRTKDQEKFSRELGQRLRAAEKRTNKQLDELGNSLMPGGQRALKLAEENLEEGDLIINPFELKRRRSRDIFSKPSNQDHEISMARSDLLQCIKNSEQLLAMLEGMSDSDNLEGWVQEKITKATDYLNTVREYLEGVKTFGVHEGEDLSWDDPDLVKMRKMLAKREKEKSKIKSIKRDGYTEFKGIDREIERQRKAGNLKEGSYKSQYPSQEEAVAYAKEQVKSFRDPLDGIEIWAMPDGGADVVHTMNSNGREHAVKNGGKKIGTVRQKSSVAEAYDGEPDEYHVLRHETQFDKDREITMPAAWTKIKQFDSYQAAKLAYDEMKAKYPKERFTITTHKKRVEEEMTEAYDDSMTDAEWEREWEREKLEKEQARKEIQKNHVSQFKTKDEAIQYANDKLKTFKDPKIGMSVYAMLDGGFDVISTARTAAAQKRSKLISDAGGKHLGTLGPRYTKHKMKEGSRDPWKEKEFGPTIVIKKIFSVKTDDKTYQVKAETEQDARRAVERHVPDVEILDVKFVKNLMAETHQLDEKGKGLWANIRAKQKRIKAGSGERMRKPGSKGAPSDKDLTSIRAASKNESLENIASRDSKENDPWEKGWKTFFRRGDVSDNPYERDTIEYQQWLDGYREGESQPNHYDEGVDFDKQDQVKKQLDVKTPSLSDIAKKHGVDQQKLLTQLKKGIKVELEHTTNQKIAKEIALDHLSEFPDYYDKLKRVETSESMMTEAEKDACYHKVKSRYKVWPSAYASGALSKCRKVGAKNWGNKSKK